MRILYCFFLNHFTISLSGLGSDVVTRFLTQTKTCLNPKCNLYRFRAYSWITRYTSYLFGYIENMVVWLDVLPNIAHVFIDQCSLTHFVILCICFSMHKFSHCESSRNTGLLSGNYSEIYTRSRIHTYVNCWKQRSDMPKVPVGACLVWGLGLAQLPGRQI